MCALVCFGFKYFKDKIYRKVQQTLKIFAVSLADSLVRPAPSGGEMRIRVTAREMTSLQHHCRCRCCRFHPPRYRRHGGA